MKLFRQARGSGGSRHRKLVGLALAASLVLPAGVVAGLGLASSTPAGASVAPTLGDTGSVYVPIQPCRLLDTVSGSGSTANGQTLVPGDESITTADLHNACQGQVPSAVDIDAVAINLTAVKPTTAGFLTAFGAGQQPPATSTVNFVAGQTIANEATIATDEPNFFFPNEGYGGAITIDNYVGTTDVIVDVQGYYTHEWSLRDREIVDTVRSPGSDIADNGGLYYPLTPFRVFDTRAASGYQGQNETLGPDSQLNFFPGDQPDVPGGTVPPLATAVVLNVTAINPTASTFLTLWDDGGSFPASSNINAPAGTTIANRVIVPLTTNGQVSIYNLAGNTDVAVDVDGYFSNFASEPNGFCSNPETVDNLNIVDTPGIFCTGSSYYPIVTPQRIADTRTASGYEDAGQTIHGGEYDTVNIPADSVGANGTGFGPYLPMPGDTDFAPDSFSAVDVNVTVTDTTAPSYLTIYPANDESGEPNASDINWVPGDIISNGDLASTGSSPSVAFQVFNYAGTTDAVVDLYGYYSSADVDD